MKRSQNQIAIDRFETLMRIRGLVTSGFPAVVASRDCGISPLTFKRWSSRYDAEGIKGLRDLPRSGRPSKVPGKGLRQAYLNEQNPES